MKLCIFLTRGYVFSGTKSRQIDIKVKNNKYKLSAVFNGKSWVKMEKY
jgi:hypothetical protein